MQIQNQSSKKSTAITSRSTDSILLRDSNQRNNGNTRELPYVQLSVALDNNQNYKKYEPTNNSTNRHESITMIDTTTVIPNFYSIREEIRRELKLSKQVRLNCLFFFISCRIFFFF